MYNHQLVELKWKKKWAKDKTYAFQNEVKKPKFYVLDMFPYPSGSGLHVGHPKGYTATDILSRYKKMKGYNVLHPIGWDAFGLPAEQYALNTNNDPRTFTNQNIKVFKKQLESLGFCFDFDKEVNTTDPNFYQWTQWIFLQMYKKGLAEIQEIEVNWCEKLNTVLANEEVLTDSKGNKVSERGSYPVIRKKMKQWVLKITKYAEELLNDLETLDWTDGLKNIQKTWIGKSLGANIDFKIKNSEKFINIFTSRPDTIFGVSFIGLSANHPFVSEKLNVLTSQQKQIIENILNDKEYERTKNIKDPIGFFIDEYCVCPFSNKEIPIYVCDYVLPNYGSGAIMGVPFSDEWDFYFANKYKLPINKIFDVNESFWQEDGIHINSEFLDGKNIEEATKLILDKIKEKKIGGTSINYKLKDWIFSRQRYWGEPFPILFDKKGNIFIETNLPLVLPKSKKFTMTKEGKPPLAHLTKWVNVKKNNLSLTREVNTMPQWAGSCWYYLAYILKNSDGSYIPLNSKKAYTLFERWLPVDVYVGGQEHAVLHLLYSRFWHKFLYDLKIVPTKEPFQKVINQGMILGENNEKMSKSKGNVINPDEIIKTYGADALRVYEMFMGPLTSSLPWSDEGLNGIYKWLQRVYRLFEIKKLSKNTQNNLLEQALIKLLNNTEKMIENFEYNLVISEMMIYINECFKYEELPYSYMVDFIKVLSCFAPFISEEIWNKFLKQESYLFNAKWPVYDLSKLSIINCKLPVQINGKVRDVFEVKMDLEQEEIMQLVNTSKKINDFLQGKTIYKIIYVKNKILNLLVK